MEMELPRRYQVQKIPAGVKPDELLIKGELDAVILTSLFFFLRVGLRTSGGCSRTIKRSRPPTLKKTGIFPIMHTVAMREICMETASPGSPPVSTKLSKSRSSMAYERLNDLSPYKLSMVWFREPMAQQREALGEDPWCDGVQRNRRTLETLIGYLYEQEMITKKPAVDDLFAPNTLR